MTVDAEGDRGLRRTAYLHNLLREKGISAAQLEEQLGLSSSAISHRENGDAYPPLDVCIKPCVIFDCSMDYLVGLSDIKKATQK